MLDTLPKPPAAPAADTRSVPVSDQPTSPPAGPSVHRRALVTWLSVYPLITIVLWLLGDVVVGMPLPLETLILTGIVVPLSVYIVVPRISRLLPPPRVTKK